jgi:L-cystine uptake protein TcyP (sodium:dicarboxylate symporter family)
MELPNISWTPDVIILVVLGVVIAYGLLLGRNKVKTLALSVYVGIVIASELGIRLHQLMVSHGWDMDGFINQNVVLISMLVLPLLLLEVGRREHHGRGGGHAGGGMLMTIILCILTAALAVSSGLQLLDPDTLKYVTDSSWLATAVHNLRLWWLGAAPLAVIAENFIKPKERY